MTTKAKAPSIEAPAPMQAPAPQPPVTPAEPVFVENLMSFSGGVSAMASANAPFVYFDVAPFLGYHAGVGEITLLTRRPLGPSLEGGVLHDLLVSAHLRASVPALKSLRQAIDNILLLAEPTAGIGAMN